MNKRVCLILLFGLCGCTHLRPNTDAPASDTDAWRHFLLHQQNFSKHGLPTGVPREVEAAALAFGSELQQAVNNCQLNGSMENDPDALVAKYRASLLALPSGARVQAVVLGRQKNHVNTRLKDLGLYSNGKQQFSNAFLDLTGHWEEVTQSTVTDGYDSNCYTYNLELVTGLRIGRYPDELLFFPVSN